jgi:hypothetical protein
MTFVTMQQELSDRLGAYDNAVADDLTKLKRWLNMGYQYICGKMNWPFLLGYEIVQTVADITTGTVSVTAASSTITFSSAPTVSVANRYIKFSSSDDWYQITAHTANVTTATISPSYGQTSNLSGGTYTVRKLLYATTTPLVSYLDIKKTVNPGIVESVSQRLGDFFLPLYMDTGDSYAYIMGPQDSSGNLQFSLVPPPSTPINLLTRGIKAVTDMSSDSDLPIFPAKWHDACIDMGAHYGFIGLDDDRSKIEFERADVKISDMGRVYSPDLGRHRVMSAVDAGAYSGPAYTLPSNYGPTVY